METINASGKVYTLYSVTGKVVATNKNMETRVSGGGGGGYTHQGTGFSSPVTVTSTTTIHDQIFLVDDTGREHSFQLQDFNVACREGNVLKVIWAVKKGKDKGDYIIVQNNSTGQSFFNIGAIRRMFRPSWLIPLALTVIFLYIGSGLTIFAAVATWAAFIYYTINKATAFKNAFTAGKLLVG